MSDDDPQLIAASLLGRKDAFEEIVRRYQDRLYNTVFRLVGNREDAQDVVQEAFLSAYQSLGRFKGNAKFFTWLYRIAFNGAISLKRKQRSATRRRLAASPETLDPPDLSESSKPGHAMEVAEQERRLQDGLDRLSMEHRTVLILKDIEGMQYEEMAEILEVPIGTVRSRLHRARLELREILQLQEVRE